MTGVKIPSLAIVIASCDKYSDLWDPVVGEFINKWKNCPYPIYLVSNEKPVYFKGVEQILVGPDQNWSATMRSAIETIAEKYILFWLDDVFLDSEVDGDKIAAHLDWMKKNQVDFLRLRANPRPSKYAGFYGKLGIEAAYRVSIFATIWKKEVFLDIVRPGETAWEFELNGTERSSCYSNFFATKSDNFKYRHGVEKGAWLPWTYSWLKRKGYCLEGRAVMSKMESVGAAVRKLKSIVLDRFPEGQRKMILKAANSLYRFLGLRS